MNASKQRYHGRSGSHSKAFKPRNLEHRRASKFFGGLHATVNRVWSMTSAIAEFMQGFWFGSKLVCEDWFARIRPKGHPGAIVGVFWAS